MKIRRGVFTGLALLFSSSLFASTGLPVLGVTGAPIRRPEVSSADCLPSSSRVIGVIPVVSTVTGAAASMAASVNVAGSPFTLCGAGSPSCNNDIWAAQWTIVAAPSGIQAVNAYQGSTVKIVNNSGSLASVGLRCQVGQMTGSCIFTIRLMPIADPLF